MKFRKPHVLIQLPLYSFARQAVPGFCREWEKHGTEYRVSCQAAEYGVPKAFEQDILNCLLILWQQQTQEFTHVDILKLLGKDNARSWSSKISQGLLRLANAHYTFENCVLFGEVVETKLIQLQRIGSGRGLRYRFELAEVFSNFLEEKGKYQVLDWDFTLQLPCGVSRRLYEILEKKRRMCRDDVYFVGEQQIAHWIPIGGNYSSERLRPIQRAVENLVKVGYLAPDCVLERVCRFRYQVNPQIAKSFVFHNRCNPISQTPQVHSENLPENYTECIQWLKQVAPNFSMKVLEGFDKHELAEYFPILKEKFEEVKADSIDNPAGWILTAIRGKWQSRGNIRHEKKSQHDQKRNTEFLEFQKKNFVENEQNKMKFVEQEKLRAKILEFCETDWENIYSGIAKQIGDVPSTARGRIVKIHFCNEVARIVGFDEDLLDFSFCDWIVGALLRFELKESG